MEDLRHGRLLPVLLLFLAATSCSHEQAHVLTPEPPPPPRSHLLRVPSEYARIQDAMDAAEAGDTVLVASGLYLGLRNCGIDSLGKDISMISHGRDHPGWQPDARGHKSRLFQAPRNKGAMGFSGGHKAARVAKCGGQAA